MTFLWPVHQPVSPSKKQVHFLIQGVFFQTMWSCKFMVNCSFSIWLCMTKMEMCTSFSVLWRSGNSEKHWIQVQLVYFWTSSMAITVNPYLWLATQLKRHSKAKLQLQARPRPKSKRGKADVEDTSQRSWPVLFDVLTSPSRWALGASMFNLMYVHKCACVCWNWHLWPLMI